MANFIVMKIDLKKDFKDKPIEDILMKIKRENDKNNRKTTIFTKILIKSLTIDHLDFNSCEITAAFELQERANELYPNFFGLYKEIGDYIDITSLGNYCVDMVNLLNLVYNYITTKYISEEDFLEDMLERIRIRNVDLYHQIENDQRKCNDEIFDYLENNKSKEDKY